MDAKELRVGNWVYDCINKKNVIVNGFHSTTIWLLNNNNQYQVACSIPKPIPLTEEILLKCGFSRIALVGSSLAFVLKENNFIVYKSDLFGFCFYRDKNPIRIKHLHQLQNLYFALTNSELEIEL